MIRHRNARRSIASLLALLAVAACEPSFLPPTPPPAAVAAAPSADAAAPLPPAVHHAPSELDPSLATAEAPEVFLVDFTTTQGDFVVEAHRSWAPRGADRFYNLVKLGFFDDMRFFRAIPDFMVQFGIAGDPEVAAKWREATLADDPVTQSNLRGFMSFAQTGQPNSRTTQVFICFANHPSLDASGFAPFAKVTRGMDVVDNLYKGYGEGAPHGRGPDQTRIQTEGNAYLDRDFPKLDRILSSRIVEP
ncbi:MAG TPA: peptidylprolyl isomerase [Polyangiaceae bacterium]|jgi:peptidyl-prolyl cis-trans isomerase A (cyclophilin A)